MPGTKSNGKESSSQYWLMTGATLLSINVRTFCRIARSESFRTSVT